MDNIISYAAFLKDRTNFIKASGHEGSEFNIYDTPSHKFFKILFYFWNDDYDNNTNHSGGLLAPTWEIFNKHNSEGGGTNNKYYTFDSAWAYLKNNDENERAEKLEQFVTLLSNINSECPWYFSEVTGIPEALTRKVTSEIKIEEERKKISIKCLPDAYDNRIDTLLSLYRDITWSWINKKEILPANLRKFDMGIYIWESPIYALNTNSVLAELSADYTSSYKLIEFRNCEFDYDSIHYGYETLNNKEGFNNEFTIDIFYDDCYEHTYNSLMMRTIGDVIMTDMTVVIYDDSGVGNINEPSVAQGQQESYYNTSLDIANAKTTLKQLLQEASTREEYWLKEQNTSKIFKDNKTILDGYKGSKNYSNGFINNMINQTAGYINRELKSAANRLFLGNLYTYSISKMSNQLKSVLHGNVFNTINAVDEYAETNVVNTIHNNSIGNLAGKLQKDINRRTNDRREGLSNQTKIIGNLYKSKTIANNI